MTTQLRSPTYDREQVDSALLAFAVCGGNASQAARRLREEGIEVKPRTLRTWVEKRHRDRYLQLSDKYAETLDRELVQRTRQIALRASEVEMLAIAETEKELNAHEAKDPSSAARNLATVKGINTDKMLTLTGRPNQIVDRREIGDLLRKLTAVGVVDSSAIEEAQLEAPALGLAEGPEAATGDRRQ